jgi:hypothetical protein
LTNKIFDSASFSPYSQLDFLPLVSGGEECKSFFKNSTKEGESKASGTSLIVSSLFSFSSFDSSSYNFGSFSCGVVVLTPKEVPSLIFGTILSTYSSSFVVDLDVGLGRVL